MIWAAFYRPHYSRAVHIEILEGMTTDVFIHALQCFIAICGAVRVIQSNQDSNVVRTKNELKRALKEVDKDRVAGYLIDKQYNFHMNTLDSSYGRGKSGQ